MKKTWRIILIISVIAMVGFVALGWYLWQSVVASNNLPCGGVAGFACPTGYDCQTDDPRISDDVGHCVRSI